MLPALRRHVVKHWLGGDDDTWVVLHEQETYGRIPDLVLARIDMDALEERVRGGWDRPLRRPEVAALRVLRPDRPATLAYVAARLFVGAVAARRVLRGLVAEGFADELRPGMFVRLAPAAPIVTRFVSFEAKLSDWRSALSQARSHAGFAHESWVAFDAAFAPVFGRAQEYFALDGVGLLSLDSSTERVRTVVRSSRRAPDTFRMALVGESVLAALQGRTLKPPPQTRLPGVSGSTADRGALSVHGPLSGTLVHRLSASWRRRAH
jgi:hypothetical protein